MRRRGRPQRQFVGVLEIVPERTRLKVRFVDFPAPVGIVNAPLQPALLLVLADVQQTLDRRGAAVGQHLLERADVAVPALAPSIVDQARDVLDDDRLVVRSVEDHDLAHRRYVAMMPPQEIALGLLGSRHFVRDRVHPKRIDPLEHGPDGAVLAGSVHPLQNQQ